MNTPKKIYYRREFLIVLGWLLAITLLAADFFRGRIFADDTYDYLEVFAEAYDHVDKDYVEEVDKGKLFTGAIRGMLQPLDRHSSYLPASDFKQLEQETEGQFGGLGISVGLSKDGDVTVFGVVKDTPAEEVDLQTADRIIEIDGMPTQGLTTRRVVEMLRGMANEPVELKIERDDDTGNTEILTKEVIRGIIHRPSLVDKKMLPGNIGYMRLEDFSKSSGEEVKKAVLELKDEGMQGLILDLRFNPGGLLDGAVEVSDVFLDGGMTIVTTRGRRLNDTEKRTSRERDTIKGIPMAVLVNEQSASAAEIVAGALKDNDRATVVGAKTYGKASVQAIVPLRDRSALRLTTAHYYTPDEVDITTTGGIEPDISVPYPPIETMKKTEEEIREILHRELVDTLVRAANAFSSDYFENNEEIEGILTDRLVEMLLQHGRQSWARVLDGYLREQEIYFMNDAWDSPEKRQDLAMKLFDHPDRTDTFDDLQLDAAIESLKQENLMASR